MYTVEGGCVDVWMCGYEALPCPTPPFIITHYNDYYDDSDTIQLVLRQRQHV